MSLTTQNTASGWMLDTDPLLCLACAGDLSPAGEGLRCKKCGHAYPIRDGVLVVKDEPAPDNQIARDFYNSPLWPKFRFWEWFFFLCNGGERKSRNVILRHLPQQAGIKLLDVAIGDGVYVDWLPHDWKMVGIDVSTYQLANCRRRNSARDLRLVLGEAESLPFRDQAFDAVLSIGGFNHFQNPEGALREMVRVVRPGSTIVISDEIPNFTDRLLFHKIGLASLDRWLVARSIGKDFADLVERHRRMDIAEIGRRVLKDSHYELIWHGGGYVMVGKAP